MTLAELKAPWAPGAETTVTRWSDVRKGWPDQRRRRSCRLMQEASTSA